MSNIEELKNNTSSTKNTINNQVITIEPCKKQSFIRQLESVYLVGGKLPIPYFLKELTKEN